MAYPQFDCSGQGTEQIIGYDKDRQTPGKNNLALSRFLKRLVEARFDVPTNSNSPLLNL